MAINYCLVSIAVGITVVLAGGGTALKIKNKWVGYISGSAGFVLIALGIFLGVFTNCGLP